MVSQAPPFRALTSALHREDLTGSFIACSIFSLWGVSLAVLLSHGTAGLGALSLLGVLWQAFLFTGLFITAHDAMHGAVCPQNPKLNHFIGTLALLLYGFFSYQELLKKHWQHHFHPASDRDPDYHDGQHESFIAWYLHFMRNYWSWRRFWLLPIPVVVGVLALHIPFGDLMLFWALPAILSSLQLFYFGTFLPHQEPSQGYADRFRAQSTYRSTFWSFLTCYQFGYHHEHHEVPEAAWWQLPGVVRQGKAE